MSSAITDFQPVRLSFSVRFVQGYRYLDKCGEALVRLEDTLDAGWIPGEASPTSGVLQNYSLGLGANFNTKSLSVNQTEFISFEHFAHETCNIYEILRSTFGIKRILAPSFRALFQVGFSTVDLAGEHLRDMGLCKPSVELLAALGGEESAFDFTLCTNEDIKGDENPANCRRRIAANVIQQEIQPPFDERIMMRLSLLQESHRKPMADLRKLRRQHAKLSRVAVQFDVENSFEQEFDSRSFDVSTFLTQAHEWTKDVGRFLSASKK